MPSSRIFALFLFLMYTAAVGWLTWMGRKKTTSLRSFAIGNRDMGAPVVVLALAASFTSSATLLVMPGYIYFDGISGIIYLMVSQQIGLLTGLLVIGSKVRGSNAAETVLTIPQWFKKKYDSKAIGRFYATQSILLITFMVLVVVSIGYLFSNMFGIPYAAAVIGTIVYVFGYSLLGGSYAHSYTNFFQGAMMVAIVLYLFFNTFPESKVIWEAFSSTVVNQAPEYFNITNSKSFLFRTPYEVFYCAFIMGFCNVFQPHIFNKALYLKKESSWTKVSLLSIIVITLFNLILFVGIFIRIKMPGLTNPDSIMSVYLAKNLDSWVNGLVAITIVAAAMSTLDGLVVGISSIIATDLIPEDISENKSLKITQYIVIVIAILVGVLSINPPSFIGVYGMWGYNMMMSAAFVPMIMSLWMPDTSKTSAVAASLTALIGFVVIMSSGVTINPAFACGITIPLSVGVALVTEFFIKRLKPRGQSSQKLIS